MILDAIADLVEGRHLTRGRARGALGAIMSGDATPAQVAAFLVALHMKGETVDEITGLAETMREKATPIKTTRRPLVDTCGTGGDRSGTFNISTTAAFVVAGAGIAVAKHGNRSATSQCGSADVLEELGVNIEAGPEKVAACIDEVGIGFLFARSLHLAMKFVAPIRNELKVRTIFNILGPLTNPAGACGQVVGVPRLELIQPVAETLANLGTRHAFVVSAIDGLDEFSLSSATRVAEARNGRLETYEVSPGDLGLNAAPREAVLGGTPKENAAILRRVLSGNDGPTRDIVVLNAAAAIVAGAGAENLCNGVAMAQESIDSGRALEKLDTLVAFSHDS